jgi:uncharacterized membrane protein (UPF0127 family)
MSKKNQRENSQQLPRKRSRNKPYIIGAIAFAALMLVYFVGKNLQSEKLSPADQAGFRPDIKSAVAFQNQGQLRFLDKNDNLLCSVNIEIADDDAKRTQGLMYRDSMAESEAMLFIFPDEAERSFWMKNTIMPLDIIYADSAKQIITVQKNAVPYSEASIPSDGPAQYVVEVNAGFSDRHNIRRGDHIEWTRF